MDVPKQKDGLVLHHCGCALLTFPSCNLKERYVNYIMYIGQCTFTFNFRSSFDVLGC